MCKKLLLIVVIVFTLLLSSWAQGQGIDVTGPLDTVVGAPDENTPPNELPPFAVDDQVGTKYLHYDGGTVATGFRVTPAMGSTLVTGLTFTTANDTAGRDPVSYELSGSNDSIDGPYTLIAEGPIVDFDSATEWPRRTKNTTPIEFSNDIAYEHYQVLFPTVRDPANDGYMQIAEVELLMRIFTATDPFPADGAVYENTWATMGWTAGAEAASHDVYMSDNLADVQNSAPEAFHGNQDTLYFVVGFTNFPFPDGLVSGTTYYWRVDEINEANPNSPWVGDIWSFTVPPVTAWKPFPPNGGQYINLDADLSWSPGWGTILHTVYFGDNFDDVNNAAGGTAQPNTTYTLDPLESKKTYYWRVDELDEFQSTHKGDVWSFTTTGGGGGIKGEYFNNVNLSGTPALVRIDPSVDFDWGDTGPGAPLPDDGWSVRWTADLVVLFDDMYTFHVNSQDGTRLWIDGELVLDMWVAWVTTKYASLPVYLESGIYSLRLEFFDGGEPGGVAAVQQLSWSTPTMAEEIITAGSLQVPLRASSPSPSNGATGTNMTPILSWGASDFAASHEVYFSTDANAVKNATTDSPEYKGPKALGDENYDPGKLARFTEYFWRVDEVNNLDPDSPWIGNLWSFTTGDFIVVDDVESYSGDNPIWENWRDGVGYGVEGSPDYYPGNGTGSAAGDDTVTSTAEENIVHGGGKAMPVWYNNIATATSEIELTLSPAQDWTTNGLLTLSLWFYGDAANVPGQLYVKVNDVQKLYDGDASNLTKGVWQPWNIDLASFGDLQNVTKIVIGIQGIGATGKLIFDDIRLYALARETITPVQPDPAGLVAQYAFDGNANDSIGSNHGTLQGDPQWVAGYYGNALEFDGLGDWLDCGNDPSLGISGAVSVTGWIKIGAAGIDHKIVGNQDGTNGGYKMSVVNDRVEFEIRTSANAAVLNRDVAGGAILEVGVWNHVTGIYSQQDGYIRTYVNGRLDRELLTNEVLGASPGTLYIGCEPYDTSAGHFNGVMDDFRIYNRVLSDAEIAGLAGMTKPFDKPF